MGLWCVPKHLAHVKDHVILNEDYDIKFDQGKLIWKPQDGSGKAPEGVKGGEVQPNDGGADQTGCNGSGTLDEHEIILICRESSGRSDESPSTVTTAYTIYSLHEHTDDHERPHSLSSLSAPHLPQPLLDDFLLEQPPAHLVDAEDLQVVVSTKSGTGLAKAVYDSVLSPLFAVFGLRARDHHSPAPDVNSTTIPDPSYQLFITKSRHSIRELAHTRWGTSAAAVTTNTQQRAPSPHQLIVLLSGDGGMVDLLNGAGEPGDTPSSSLDTRTTIALLPLGTGNALFHSLQKPLYRNMSGSRQPSNLLVGLRTLLRGEAVSLPTFRASFSPGSVLVPPAPEDSEEDIHGQDETGGSAAPAPVAQLLGAIVASHGFHAQLVWESDTAAYRKHGAKRFGMAAAELLKIAHAYQVEVEVRSEGGGGWRRIHPHLPTGRTSNDGSDMSERFMYVLSTMVSNLEKTFTVSPESRPLDGQLRLVSFGAIGPEKTMALMQAAYDNGNHVNYTWASFDNVKGEQGKAVNDKVVGYDKAEEIKITIREEDRRWRKVCIDGTIVEIPQDGWMHVRKTDRSRFRVLVDSRVL